MISYIIPHKDRKGLLLAHLKALSRSVFADYEVVVVNDGSDYDLDIEGVNTINLNFNHGPARARNIGAFEAQGDILLFVGDDCIPTEDLLLHHYISHQEEGVSVVQGLTQFHPNQMGTHFMSFLDKSGLQANWGGLKNEDGSWKKEISGFFLTTNVSIKRDDFVRLGGFDTSFPMAAWEDVEFGTKVSRNQLRSVFQPLAVNFHQHGYNYWQFCDRQYMEGTQRRFLVAAHPEMAPSLINPQQLRDITAQAHELEVVNNGLMLGNLNSPKFINLQYELWAEGLQVMSIMGLAEGIRDSGGVWNVLFHLHTQEEVVTAISGIRAIEVNQDWGYAQHCKHWLLEKSPGNWAAFMYAAEIDLACNDKEMSSYFYKKALELAPNESWVKEFQNG